MRHMIRYASVVIAAVLLCACQAEVDRKLSGGKSSDSVEITVSCPSPDSRTDIEGLNPVWRAGDELWISDGSASVKVTVPQEYDGLPSANLSVDGICADSVIYAVYPYDENISLSSGNLVVSVPSVQNGSFADAHLMVGASGKGDCAVKLHNASAVLKFSLSREDIQTMQIQSTSLFISGSFKLDPSTGRKTGNSDPLRRLTVDINGSAGDLYAACMEVNLPVNSKLIFITKDGRLGSITLSKRNVLENGTLYDLGELDDMIEFGEGPSQDISAEESASCYIVPGGGSYRLRTVKGNSDVSVGDVAYGDVVWETVNTTTAPGKGAIVTDVIYSGGYLYFNVPEDAPDGNALISACDVAGNILWSWHIWVLSDGVKEQTWPGGAIMLDRNLGALTSARTALSGGFLYQWGRKDPFPVIAKFSSSSKMGLSGTTVSTVASSSTTGTIDYATANPAKVIYMKSGDWLTVSDLTIWSSKVKTIYDPCPPGYLIPSEAAFSGITTEATAWDATNKGRYMQSESGEIWFPATGYLQSSDGVTSSIGAWMFYFYDQNSSPQGRCTWKGTSTSMAMNTSTSPHASAYSVRCQKRVASGVKQYVTVLQDVPDYDLVSAGAYVEGVGTGTAGTSAWGDDSSDLLNLKKWLWHSYRSAGTYSLVVECSDVETVTIGPLRHTTVIDFSRF